MFWLPHGWFPFYAEWIISFPRAPLGSVSIASWQLACTAVVTLLSDLLRGIFGTVFSSRAETKTGKKMKEEPVKAAGEKGANSTGASTGEARKRNSSSSNKEKQEL